MIRESFVIKSQLPDRYALGILCMTRGGEGGGGGVSTIIILTEHVYYVAY